MVFSSEPLTIEVIILRVGLAVMLGGLIGLERGVRSHPAGFRTHILVCVGACLAMLTNQFVYEGIGSPGVDPTRMGAQVISGIGFLGVGTIFMAGRNSVKGLTTAAGLWASGTIGLAAGIGFYAGAVIAGIIVLVVLGVFPAFENVIYRTALGVRLNIEFDSIESEKAFDAFLVKEGNVVKSKNVVSISNVEGAKRVTAQYAIRLKRGLKSDVFVETLAGIDGIQVIEVQ